MECYDAPITAPTSVYLRELPVILDNPPIDFTSALKLAGNYRRIVMQAGPVMNPLAQ